MTRRPVAAGNWKMNAVAAECRALIDGLKGATATLTAADLVICPPAVHLALASELVRGSRLHVGAQNLHWEEKGAYTGELSAAMVNEVASYVIVGHSERRAYFCETDESVNKRTAAALRAGLLPIVCVGETLTEREGGDTEAVLERQVKLALQGLTLPDTFILAYEPVWAIGTGRAATAGQAGETIAFIRDRIAGVAGGETAAATRILYGGSVTPANVEELMAQPDIDGALVGGASLKVDDFAAICRAINGSA